MNGFLESLNWIVTGIALTGAFLVARKDSRGFYCWVVSNSFLALYNFHIENFAGCLLFTVYLMITVYGIYNSKKT